MNVIKKIKRAVSTGAKASVVYTLASLFSKGLAIITMPIFTRLMPTEEIGVVNLYNSWHAMLAVVVSLSLTSGGFSLAMKEYKEKRDQYISSVLTLTSMMAVLLGIVYFLAPTFWSNLLGLPHCLIVLMLIHFLLSPAYDFWLMRQRYEYKYKAAGIVTMLTAFTASVVSVFAVVTASRAKLEDLGVVRLYANYTVMLGVALVFWIKSFYKGRTLISAKFWKFSLALSIPLIGNAFASQILTTSDRVMIGRMVGNSAVGIYSTLYTVSSLSLLIWQSINASFVPYLFDNIDKLEKRENIRSISFLLFALFAGIAFLMTLVAPEIVRILATKEYYEAIYIMPPIAAGVFLTAVTNMYSNVLIYHKKTKYIMVSTIVAAIVNVVLNYLLIPVFGYMAAAYTTLVAYIIHAFIQGVISTKVQRNVMGNSIYNNYGIIALSAAAICLCLSCLLLYDYTILRYATGGMIMVICLNGVKGKSKC